MPFLFDRGSENTTNKFGHCTKIYAQCPSKLLFYRFKAFFCSEKQGYAPNTSNCDYGIDYSCNQRILSAAYPSDDIEFKESDASPIEGTDYR